METVGDWFNTLPLIIRAIIIGVIFILGSAMNGYNIIHGRFPRGIRGTRTFLGATRKEGPLSTK